MRRLALAVPLCLLLAGCADPLPPGEEEPPSSVPTGLPDVAEIVCKADGSSIVETPQVLVQPDGIHVRVVSRLDEPAEMVGLFGMDVEPGETEYISVVEPGSIEAGCFPYSQHEDPDSLVTSTIEILDPEGLHVDGKIECTGTASSMIADFFEAPLDAGPVPLDVARSQITGLRDDDEVVHTGYPEQEEAGVAVVRHGAVVATFGFITFDGQKWAIETAEICSSSGVSHRGG